MLVFASLPGCGASSSIPIPSDSIAVVEINCKQLLNTRFPSGEAVKEFAPILFQLMGQSPELMEKNLSFNPLEDVDRIIIASGGSEKLGFCLFSESLIFRNLTNGYPGWGGSSAFSWKPQPWATLQL